MHDVACSTPGGAALLLCAQASRWCCGAEAGTCECLLVHPDQSWDLLIWDSGSWTLCCFLPVTTAGTTDAGKAIRNWLHSGLCPDWEPTKPWIWWKWHWAGWIRVSIWALAQRCHLAGSPSNHAPGHWFWVESLLTRQGHFWLTASVTGILARSGPI